MKAILVIDEMPTKCEECQFCGIGGRNLERYVCSLTGEHGEDMHLVGCPLRPIPNEACDRLVEGLDAIEKMKSVEVKVVRRTE